MVLRDDKKARPPGRGVQSIEVGGRLLTAMVNAGGAAMLRDLAQAASRMSGSSSRTATRGYMALVRSHSN
jgi:hypothetical protein